jgi:iron complex outermembrane receptor protein
MTVRDALVSFQVAGADGREFFRNAGRTRHRGVELSVSADVGGSVALAGTYALSDVRFLDDGNDATGYEGNRVPGITPHRAFASVTWAPLPTRIVVELQHHARQYADDANMASAPSYTLVEFRAETAFRLGAADVSPFVAVHNALDRRYFGSLTVNAAALRYYEPAPPRSFTAGAVIRTGAWRGK